MKVLVTMREALSDPQLLADALPGESWSSWRVLLIAAAGEKLTRAERKIFQRLTGRAKEPGALCECLLAVVGRRGGKSKAAAVFLVWLSCCVSWEDCLSLGETGVALLVAPTERQAAVLADYIRAIIKNTPLLASLIEDETQLRFRLKRHVAIEILAANAKWVRGLTAIGIAMDETAYLPSNEDAANSDISILEALRPSVATTGAPILITSSPSTTTGIVHSLWKKHYGSAGDPSCIVVQSDSRGLNPSLRQSVVDKAFETDAEAAAAEFGGQFRQALSGYISRETIERLVDRGVHERQPLPGIAYHCFVDAASGSGQDWFAACIGHVQTDGDRRALVVDMLLAQKPPFDPLAVVAALAGTLQRYRITEIVGDNYAGGFLPSAFAKHRIQYRPCTLNASELYLAALPTFTSGSISLLDNPGLFEQLVNLRRKVGQSGRDSVSHMRGQHDDVANALVGLVHMLTPIESVTWDFGGGGDTWGVITRACEYVGYSDEPNETAKAWARARGYTPAPDGGLGRRIY